MKFSFWEDTGQQKIASDFEMPDFCYEEEGIDEAIESLQIDLSGGHEDSRTFVYKTDSEKTWWSLTLRRTRDYFVSKHDPLTFDEVLSLFEAL